MQCSRQGERAETSSSPLLGTHVLAAGELLEEGLWRQSPHASLARAVQTPEPPPLLGRPMGTEWAGLGQRGPRWGRFPGSPHGPPSVPQTQPVPNPVAYFLHRSPWWVHRIETLGNHFLELVVPFFVFLGRRMCVLHGVLQILFQVSLSHSKHEHPLVGSQEKRWDFQSVLCSLFLLSCNVHPVKRTDPE